MNEQKSEHHNLETRKVLITIPARSGSKRLPGKNTLPLGGKPLIYYTIKAALDSGITDYVYVLSDSKKTLALAEEYGVRSCLLPADLAGDLTGVVKASLHLVEKLEKEGLRFEDIICLQPTSPLRNARDIVQSYRHFKAAGAESLVSVSELDSHYFHWAVQMIEGMPFAKLYFGDSVLKPRQGLPLMYYPNGAVKIAAVDLLRQQGHFFGVKMATYVMPPERSVAIARSIDLDLCSLLLKKGLLEEGY